MKDNGLLTNISKETNTEVYQIDFYMVVVNGEIEASFDDYDLANGYVGNIEQENTDFAISESGRDAEDLTEREYAEMQVWGGFLGDGAYVESVHIDEDVDLGDTYTTKEEDTFSYNEIMQAYLSRKFENDLFDELDDIEDDDLEDDDDFNLIDD